MTKESNFFCDVNSFGNHGFIPNFFSSLFFSRLDNRFTEIILFTPSILSILSHN